MPETPSVHDLEVNQDAIEPVHLDLDLNDEFDSDEEAESEPAKLAEAQRIKEKAIELKQLIKAELEKKKQR